jgi:hypothetical protein
VPVPEIQLRFVCGGCSTVSGSSPKGETLALSPIRPRWTLRADDAENIAGPGSQATSEKNRKSEQ